MATTAKSNGKAKPAAKTVKTKGKTAAATKAAGRTRANAAPRTDYKPGARVKVERRTGKVSKGIVAKVVEKQTGHFIWVNVGRKDEPLIIKARPVCVSGY